LAVFAWIHTSYILLIACHPPAVYELKIWVTLTDTKGKLGEINDKKLYKKRKSTQQKLVY